MMKKQPAPKPKVEVTNPPPGVKMNILEIIKMFLTSFHGVHLSYICKNEEDELALYFIVPVVPSFHNTVLPNNTANCSYDFLKNTTFFKSVLETALKFGWKQETDATVEYCGVKMLKTRFASDIVGEYKKFTIVYIPVIYTNTNTYAPLALFERYVAELTSSSKTGEVTLQQLAKAAKFTIDTTKDFVGYNPPSFGRPVVGEFGPVDPALSPFGTFNQVIQKPFEGGGGGVCGDFAPPVYGTNPHKKDIDVT